MSARGRAAWCVMAAAFLSLLGAGSARADIVVSLGDSYSSGEGARSHAHPRWDRPGVECHRSPNAWPRRLGVLEGRHLACSGATIPDVRWRGQQDDAPDDVAQLERLRSLDASVEIDTVLLTIGGNDVDFAGKIKSCVVGHKCLRDLAKLDRQLAALQGDLMDAYAAIQDATWGDLVVVGYPDIFPSRGESFRKCGWLGDKEKLGVWRLQAGFDRVMSAAAAAADVDYIPIRDALDGRELCTRDSVVNKIQIERDSDPAHPNAEGQKLIARRVKSGLVDLYADDDPAASAARVRKCGDVGFEDHSDFGAFDVAARGTNCRKARRLARASRDMNVVDGPFHYRFGGFRCRGVAHDVGLPSVDWRCRRRGATVTFTRS
jgi:lysophospholipase L1-like esterase